MASRSKYKTRADGRKTTTRTYDSFGITKFSGKKTFYGKTDAELERNIAEWENSQKEPELAEKSVAELCDEWWTEREKEFSPNSKNSYKAKLKVIKQEFGDKAPSQISTSMVTQWMRRLAAQGFSQKSLQGRKSVLKQVLDIAVADGVIESNPCIQTPKVKGKSAEKRHSASEEDIKLIEKHKTDSLIARMFYFMEYSGCRIGECVVLQEKDIDRIRHKASITKDIAYEFQEPIVKHSAKTSSGNRDIDLYDNVLEILPQYDDPETYIFFPEGLPKKSAFETATKNFRKSIGIKATAHQLRHSYATMMHSAEIDAKSTSARLGHASIDITLDTYTDLDRQFSEKVRNKVNDYIMNDRLGRDKKHCKKCGSFYTQAEDGHQFIFCPDCGNKID